MVAEGDRTRDTDLRMGSATGWGDSWLRTWGALGGRRVTAALATGAEDGAGNGAGDFEAPRAWGAPPCGTTTGLVEEETMTAGLEAVVVKVLPSARIHLTAAPSPPPSSSGCVKDDGQACALGKCRRMAGEARVPPPTPVWRCGARSVWAGMLPALPNTGGAAGC